MQSLIDAVHSRDAFAVEQYLAAGASPDSVNEKTGESILSIAAGQANLPLAQLLLEHDADPNFTGTTAWPIELAAGRGCTELVELLLDHDAETEVQDEDGCTPLIAAAAGGHLEIVNLLLEAGANARHKDRYGKRAILFAAEKAHMEIVETLAPLSTAKDRRQADLMMRLAKQGPPSDAIHNFFEAADKGDINAVKAYLETGGGVDAMDESGVTALFRAAHRGRLDIAELLVAHGANVNHLDIYGNCPLSYAGTRHKSAAYDFLYERTSKKLRDAWDKGTEKAIRMAAEYGFSEIAEFAQRRLQE